jgi:hypothetical protein
MECYIIMNALTFFENQLKGKSSDKTANKTKLDELFTTPQKEKGDNLPHFQPQAAGYEDQIDILYLPNDAGRSLCLVCIDQGNRKIDCESLNDRSSATVLQALQTIYARKIVTKVRTIRVDAGGEFAKDFKSGLQKMGIQLIVAKAGRSRSLALVERRNFTIGSLIHKLLAHNKLAGYDSSKWVEFLPDLVKAINQSTETKMKNNKKKTDVPVAVQKGTKIKLLEVNDEVRIQLDKPQSIDGKRLQGYKFRASDIRFSPEIYLIKAVLVQPNFPIMYKTTADEHARTYQQLLPVKAAAEEVIQPIGEVQADRVEVIKIMEKKIEIGIVYYLVKWSKKGENKRYIQTWEPKSELEKDIPQMISLYEKNLAKKN